MTDSSTHSPLDALEEQVGVNRAVALLVFALPLIAERRSGLQQALQAGDWQTAAQVAHQTLGSVRLYGSSQLEYLLQQVRQQDLGVISSLAFQEELDQAFGTVTTTLQEWLDAHPL